MHLEFINEQKGKGPRGQNRTTHKGAARHGGGSDDYAGFLWELKWFIRRARAFFPRAHTLGLKFGRLLLTDEPMNRILPKQFKCALAR